MTGLSLSYFSATCWGGGRRKLDERLHFRPSGVGSSVGRQRRQLCRPEAGSAARRRLLPPATNAGERHRQEPSRTGLRLSQSCFPPRPRATIMREAGVEPARLSALEPKSSASASFATLAECSKHELPKSATADVGSQSVIDPAGCVVPRASGRDCRFPSQPAVARSRATARAACLLGDRS